MSNWKTKFVTVFTAVIMLFSVSMVPVASAHDKEQEKCNMKQKHNKPSKSHYQPVPVSQPTPVPELEQRAPITPPAQTGQEQSLGMLRAGKTAVVWALKYGGPVLSKVMDPLSPKNAKLLKQWSYTLGVELEAMTGAYEARLISFMIDDLGFSPSAARNIAWAIVNLI